MADMEEICDLLFSVLISYIGALEFLYVVRHLYHWSFRHDAIINRERANESLQRLQENLRSQLTEATEREQRSGHNVMQDGVAYEDGFRIDPTIETAGQMLNDAQEKQRRRKELEAEFERQKKVEEETRRELEAAELALALERERIQKEREQEEQLIAEVARRKVEEEEALQKLENERKLLEVEKAKEEEQRLLEEARQRAEEEENERRILELEKAKEEEQKLREAEEEAQRKAEEENQRRTLELEKAKEEEHKLREAEEEAQRKAEEEENQRRLLELERAKEEEQKLREIEEAQRKAEELALASSKVEQLETEETLLGLEKVKEEKIQTLQEESGSLESHIVEKGFEEEQKLAELKVELLENEKKILEAEKNFEENQKNLEINEETDEEREERLRKEEEDLLEFARKLIAEDTRQDENDEKTEDEVDVVDFGFQRDTSPDSESQSDREVIERILEKRHISPEKKQQMIEENARKFLEAEQEMVDLLEAGMVPVEEPIVQKVKTQFNQTSNESYSLSSKPLLFTSLSDEGSSVEPKSSQQSSFSTQPSEEVTTTGPEDTHKQFPQTERQEPEGEDNIPDIQYTDEYLRSLDGIKHRPLVREDGSGRRRAFKKRRSSGSSNSSRDSRASRDEELRMFTSLEEEEMHNLQKPDSDFTPIKYTSEPNLKVKSHHRRHKRSPAKDNKALEESLKASLGMLGEETTNPWGEVVPEHYKDTEFWKREKAVSIDEEEIGIDLSALNPDLRKEEEVLEDQEEHPSRLIHKTSSFEEATPEQNIEAVESLQQQQKGNESLEPTEEPTSPTDQSTLKDNDNNKNLQSSKEAENKTHSARSSPRLRRSPRIEDHMDDYERDFEIIKAADLNSPGISIESPRDDSSWRDEHGLIMEGLSDFYDFTASVNPSRSRAGSRNPSPSVISKPEKFDFSLKKNMNEKPLDETKESPAPVPKEEIVSSPTISIHQPADEGPWRDEKGDLVEGLSDFYDFTTSINPSRSRSTSKTGTPNPPSSPEPKNINYCPNQQNYQLDEDFDLEAFKQQLLEASDEEGDEDGDGETEEEEEDLSEMDYISSELDIYDDTECLEEGSPQLEDIAQFLESCSSESSPGLSEHLQNVADRPEHSLGASDIMPTVFINDQSTSEDEMITTFENLRSERSPSLSTSARQSRSRSLSPLPTNDNILKSLEIRKQKRIKHNEEIFEKLQISSQLQETVSLESPPPTKQEMSSLIESLRADQNRSHSRSKSPLPSPSNIQKSLEARRLKKIQQNEELFERLEKQMSPEIQESSKPSSATTQSSSSSEREEMNSLIESLRAERVRSSTSRTPLLGPQNLEKNKEETKETHTLDIEALRMERGRSRSRSPFPDDRISREDHQNKNVQNFVQQTNKSSDTAESLQVSFHVAPQIFIDNTDNIDEEKVSKSSQSPEQDMSSLVANLRVQRSRSRSRSKSPMRLPSAANIASSLDSRRKKLIDRNDQIKEQLEERANSPEPPRLTVEYVYEVVDEKPESPPNQLRERQSRSRSPSRSPSPPPIERCISSEQTSEGNSKTSSSSNMSALDNLNDYLDFHMMLNLEASFNKTLMKPSEELESRLASKECEIDLEALEKFKTASEEMELRTVSPLHISTQAERLRQMKCTPTTPEYNRTISEEWRDSQRIKDEMLKKGFKRSTYVGESMDLGAEYEPLRREAAFFRRSRTPSPSIHISDFDLETSKRNAAEAREIQAQILNELTKASSTSSPPMDDIKHGAIPKIDLARTSIQSSDSIQIDLEDLRRQAAQFRRSRSKSRSPLDPLESQIVAKIENEAAKKELVDDLQKNTKHFKEFSRHLNADFLDSERRASDSALFKKPEVHIQLQDNETLEPEEYHHYRRFSLAQEQQVEEYPTDDLIYISHIEVHSPNATRTWVQEDFYSEHLEALNLQLAEVLDAAEEQEEALANAQENNNDNENDNDNAWLRNEEDSNGSEDERRTVVEVEDEIEEDLADYNERGPTDESHHEISECEEADREQDRFAGRGAQDWQNVDNVNDLFNYSDERGAFGGPQNVSYDSDSFAIDEIYAEAIKNRKQSGILRDFDSILQEMSNSFGEKGSQVSSADSDSDRERYALWAKTRALEKANHIELARSFLEQERKESEIRYLGDAEATARQSVRLRSRYGYVPVLPSSNMNDLEVDLSYKPKKEYNWRKNFKLDEEDNTWNAASSSPPETTEDPHFFPTGNDDKDETQLEPESLEESFEVRKFSLGGESITLFSQSPEREMLQQVLEETFDDNEKLEERDLEQNTAMVSNALSPKEKVKKKKSKKKTRKEIKSSEELFNKDDEDSENQLYSRRSSSIQMDTESPKRSSRSRRSSKASNEDSSLLFSPRSSVGVGEPIWDINEEYVEPSTITKKKTKKRKKSKADTSDRKQQNENNLEQIPAMQLQVSEALAISCAITPNSTEGYLLASISPQNNNKFITPPSEESDSAASKELKSRDESLTSLESAASNTLASQNQPSPVVSNSNNSFSSIDTFDILKDGNFYPLF